MVQLIVKTNARGATYHAPAIVYAVEARIAGVWERIADYWDEGQALKCRNNFIRAGCAARIIIV